MLLRRTVPAAVLGQAGDRFNGKRVVTGPTGGIGRRVCALVGDLGGEVIAVGRNGRSLSQLHDDVNGRPVDYPRVFTADFADMTCTRACAGGLEALEGETSRR